MAHSPSTRFSGRILPLFLVAIVILTAAYFAVVLNWSYSVGERAGWVQKFSKKGWLCKTWEGELSLISMPGVAPEKFEFTVTDDAVADQINRLMGQRATLHYEQRVGLPTSCFGDTRYFVTGAVGVADHSSGQGIPVPGPVIGAPGLSPSTAPAPAAAPTPVPAAPATAPVPGLPASGPILPAPPAPGAPATRP